MKASHNKVSSQTTPCLSTLGIVLPKNYPSSRTSMLPPHSPPVEKPINSCHRNLCYFIPKAPSAQREKRQEQDQTVTCFYSVNKWLHHYLLVSPKAEIFWSASGTLTPKGIEIPISHVLPQNFSLKKKLNFLKQTNRYGIAQTKLNIAGYIWTELRLNSDLLQLSPALHICTPALRQLCCLPGVWHSFATDRVIYFTKNYASSENHSRIVLKEASLRWTI